MFQTIHRLQNTSVATKVRVEKVGQHKLGSSGYMDLQSRLVSSSNGISYFFFNIMLQKKISYMQNWRY